jgi:hypothetical protein
MYTTSAAVIQESAAMYKKGNSIDSPPSLSDLAQIVGKIGSSKLKDT